MKAIILARVSIDEQNDKDFIKDFDFENFKLIFNKIKEIQDK